MGCSERGCSGSLPKYIHMYIHVYTHSNFSFYTMKQYINKWSIYSLTLQNEKKKNISYELSRKQWILHKKWKWPNWVFKPLSTWFHYPKLLNKIIHIDMAICHVFILLMGFVLATNVWMKVKDVVNKQIPFNEAFMKNINSISSPSFTLWLVRLKAQTS